MELIILLILIGVGFGAGTIAEKKHYRSIEEREGKFLRLPAVTAKNMLTQDSEIQKAEIVQGSVVISIDYFKRLLASLRNFFGGQVKSYETLVDRARREATLRMKEQAPGADIILNTRIETSTIGGSANRRKSIGSIEAIAYGTAVTYRK
jgi:uncharacterized protein YbjQ (UPF0145 family)